MENKQPAQNHDDTSQTTSLESAGRSIADDLAVETLVQVLHKFDAIPMAASIISSFARAPGSTFDKYLERRWGAHGAIRYDHPQIREEYESRLNYIKQLLRGGYSSSDQKPQDPNPS